jgi:murein DD-endopeptidase MepM/ murein hydrolase activator NlpD
VAAPDEGDQVAYAPPVVAPVTDPFRPPPQPWLPGNRGIEYATTPGTPVRAAGRGRVSFAGPVAGALHVTVAHPDGIRTSYSFLATVTVRAGADVVRGQVVGTTGPRLHVGARRGDTYIDPASLWAATGPPWVRLAPLDGARPANRRRVGGVGGVAI